jgi:uncharacterized membrane protein
MSNGVQVRECFTVNAPPGSLYRFWKRFSDFPRFMRNVRSVAELGAGRSHWVVGGPAGRTVEWDAEIVEDVPDAGLRWRTLEGAAVRHGGCVAFRPATGGRGTVVDVRMAYEPPAGAAAASLVRMLGEEPEEQIREDLRRFKSLVETGEIPTTGGQSSARTGEGARRGPFAAPDHGDEVPS